MGGVWHAFSDLVGFLEKPNVLSSLSHSHFRPSMIEQEEKNSMEEEREKMGEEGRRKDLASSKSDFDVLQV